MQKSTACHTSLLLSNDKYKDSYSSEHKKNCCLLLLVPPFKIHSNLHKLFYWDVRKKYIQHSLERRKIYFFDCCRRRRHRLRNDVERSKFILCTLFIHTTWSEMEYKRQEISWRKERNVDFIHKWCQKSLNIQKKTFSCRLRGKEIWNKTFNQLNNNNNVHWIKRLLRKWMKESWMNKNSVI